VQVGTLQQHPNSCAALINTRAGLHTWSAVEALPRWALHDWRRGCVLRLGCVGAASPVDQAGVPPPHPAPAACHAGPPASSRPAGL
jgi:hypothetical protein